MARQLLAGKWYGEEWFLCENPERPYDEDAITHLVAEDDAWAPCCARAAAVMRRAGLVEGDRELVIRPSGHLVTVDEMIAKVGA